MDDSEDETRGWLLNVPEVVSYRYIIKNAQFSTKW